MHGVVAIEPSMYACSQGQLREAVANRFVVIETREKTREENSEKIYRRVFEKLNKLFMGIPPSGSRS
jgi:hypothetical protein